MSFETYVNTFFIIAFAGALIVTATKWLFVAAVTFWLLYGLWYAVIRLDTWRRT